MPAWYVVSFTCSVVEYYPPRHVHKLFPREVSSHGDDVVGGADEWIPSFSA